MENLDGFLGSITVTVFREGLSEDATLPLVVSPVLVLVPIRLILGLPAVVVNIILLWEDRRANDFHHRPQGTLDRWWRAFSK